MKAFRALLILALAIGILGSASGASAGAFTYTSGFQVQNLEAAEAKITVTFYNQDGTTAATVPDTVGANGSKTYFPLSQVADGFNGSVVISSDKQVAAIGNVLGDGGNAAASYSAATSGATTVQIPLLMKGNSGFNTWFNVQNTGALDATVSVAYSDGTTNSATIKPGAAHTFDQSTETHSAKVFSAEVTSNQPIAATVIEESTAIMFAYSGFTGGSTNPVLPLINANNAGYVTGVQIQNSGASSTSVTVTYTDTGGATCTETQTIASKQSGTFALSAFAGVAVPGMTTTCTGGQKLVGSAQVTANSASMPLVAIVNQLGPSNGEAYNGFDPAGATAKVVMPLIMDRNGGFFTGFNVMNVGGASTAVSCTFTGSTYTVSGTVAAGAALNDLQAGKIADKYVGSATCTAGSGGKIVAVVNELGPSGSLDQLLVYEGVNAAP
jgi:hypothetical protein